MNENNLIVKSATALRDFEGNKVYKGDSIFVFADVENILYLTKKGKVGTTEHSHIFYVNGLENIDFKFNDMI